MKNRNAGKQLHRTQAIKRDCLKKLRDRRAEYQLMSNARVEYVKSIRKKRRLKERYAYCLNIPIFQDKNMEYLVKKSRFEKNDYKYIHNVKLKIRSL